MPVWVRTVDATKATAVNTAEPRYSIIMEWSDQDQVYIASLPEWGDLMHTHGETYEEVLQRGRELIELLIASRRVNGEALPEPRVFATTT
jgi:antitoxin HicB